MRQDEQCVTKIASSLSISGDVHVARVVVSAVVGLMLVLSARVSVVVFVAEFP